MRCYQTGPFYVSLKTDTGVGKSGIFRSNTDFFVYYSTVTGDTVLDGTFTDCKTLVKNQSQTGISAYYASGSMRLGFFGSTPAAKPTVTGSRGGNAALASLLTALADLGLVSDSTSA